MRPEHIDVVAEKGRRNHESMRGVVLWPQGRRRGGLYLWGGYFQILGKDVGTVRRRLVGGLLECWEGTPSMESYVETAKEGGGRATSVRNVLLAVVQTLLLFGADTWFLLE